MSGFKSSVNRLVHVFKKSRDNWKEKAMERQRRVRALQVKVRDLEKSREYWKARALGRQAAAGSEQAPGPLAEKPEDEDSRPPARHHYAMSTIRRAAELASDPCVSLRGTCRVLARFGWATPAFTTMQSWLERYGLYLLNRPLERRTDWILIADHTVALGPHKCLVILGVPATELARTGYSPSHQAIQVMALEVVRSSTGEQVVATLERVRERAGGIVQIVIDHGSDLRKGARLFCERHQDVIATYDVSHRMATFLQHELGNDSRWSAFLGHCEQVSKRLQQTALAFLRPPKQHNKARFMHLDSHLRWAQQMLAYYDRGDFSAFELHHSLTWPLWEALAAQLGRARAVPARMLIACPPAGSAAGRPGRSGGGRSPRRGTASRRRRPRCARCAAPWRR
jgi:hypothetical protein